MITGESEFNEVFFTDAKTAKENVIGEVNGGWAVAMTLLGFERGEAAATTPVAFRGELDRLTELARSGADSTIPSSVNGWPGAHSKVEIMRYLGMRTLTQFSGRFPPGADASIFKLYWSEYHKQVTELAVDISGRRRHAPRRQAPDERLLDRLRRRTERFGQLARHVPQRQGRHDLRRHQSGPAQHHR